ncbi:peptidoglycan DD-metalloendopeptidase family protein [Nocardia sienata]|uniref:peptidoglycan DD-metalloendopeptidase family protein n=1 Tax=Nocardia sienata TaxID=248552 RepID=UPI000A7794EB|nr:peptidoglycan DD-metalloendopeptidase family protein [Nocardia sienata]
MLDKAGRRADGPPTQDPDSTAPGRGTGALRRRWNRAVHPLSGAPRRDARPGASAATPEPAGHELATYSGRRPQVPHDSEQDSAEHHSGAVDTGSEQDSAEHDPGAVDTGSAATGPGRGDAPETTDPGRGGASRPETTGHDPAPGPDDPEPGTGERSISLDRAAATGGGLVIAPGWRERAAAQARTPGPRVVAAHRWLRRPAVDLWSRRPTRAELADLVARRPSAEDIASVARRHRVLIGVLLLALLLTAGDGSAGIAVTDRSPVPGIAYRVALAHPLQLSAPVPSVRRYLDAIDNGERLREQAVVAAAARATLERAKAEAAAAVAGHEQPWINTAPVPGGLEGGLIPPGAVPPGAGGYVLPAPGTFTSGFGSRWGTFHRGIDIAGPIGTPIYAVASGTVIDAGPAAGFGLWVRIRHDDGAISVYGHMYDFFVSVGERVPAGMQIARMGNRGDSTGPHLHFEIILDGRHVDPQRWLAVHGLSYQ